MVCKVKRQKVKGDSLQVKIKAKDLTFFLVIIITLVMIMMRMKLMMKMKMRLFLSCRGHRRVLVCWEIEQWCFIDVLSAVYAGHACRRLVVPSVVETLLLRPTCCCTSTCG